MLNAFVSEFMIGSTTHNGGDERLGQNCGKASITRKRKLGPNVLLRYVMP